MARGGYRVGSGRKKSPPKPGEPKPVTAPVETMRDIKAAAKAAGMTPLDYMLSVMNDEHAEEQRRDRMAIAAAPYVHARADAVAEGKKAQRQAKAEATARGEGRFAVPSGPRQVPH
jgi:hypothetical protein